MKQKSTKLLWLRLLALVAIVLCGAGSAWSQIAVVGTELWSEPFKGSPSNSTSFSETTSWGDYLNPTTFVASDASSLSYTSSNAMANGGSATYMTGAHVWLNKSVDGYIQVTGIKLYNSTKVKVSWAQANSGSSTTVYYQFDGTGDFTSLSTCSGPNDNFESAELSVANHTTIALKFFHPSSNSKNTRIDNIKLTATEVASSTPTCATPTFSPAAGPVVSGTTISINSTEGATIYYTIDGSTPSTSSSVYSDPIEITAATTIKAYALKTDYNNSEVASAAYTIVEPYANIAALTAATPSTAETGFVTLTNAVITYVNGSNAYIQDASGAVLLYLKDHGLTAGDVLNGTATVTYALRYGNPQLTDISGITPTQGETTPMPTEVAAANWNKTFNNELSKYYKITDATITENDGKYYISLGGQSVQLYGQGEAKNFTLSNLTKKYTIVGFPTLFVSGENTTLELQIFEVPEIQTYQITPVVNNSAYGTVEYDNGVIIATPAEGYRFATPAYSVTSGTATITQDGNEFTVDAQTDCTVQINFEAIPSHTATFSVNGTTTTQDFAEDAAISFPSTPADVNGKTFVGWTTNTIDGTTNTAPTFVTSATMGTENVTYYAVFATLENAGSSKTVTDVLTLETTGIEEGTTTYSNWNGKTVTSKAIYAGQSAGGNKSIQLRSANSNSGIISTASGGKLKKIEVDWNSNTTSGRRIRVFGKNTAYSEVSDVYAFAKQGTQIGGEGPEFDITYGKSTELTVNGDYEYIGVRSMDGALYLNSISITWETSTPATYSGYCTTVKEQATIRLYLPNNPEGNLTEHQLSCSSAVILNVDTNSPGAITIQDMTDGITVIPNTDNKTVTLLASTNNGKVFSQPGEYTFRVVVGETDSYTSASVDFKLKVVKFKAYFNNLTGFEETKDLANGTNGGQLKDQLFSNTQWGDASYKTWTSTNEDVATIDNDGNITLISTGQVRFIHSYTGNDYNEPCKISTGVMTVIDTTPTVLPTAPIIFHDSGEYEGELQIAMAGERTIMYTLNDGEAQTYSAPFTITEDATIKAWAVKDGVASDVTEPKTFTIKEKAKGAVVEDGYYTIQTNEGKYVNVAGRKTVTLVSDTKSAGTVIRVKAEEDGVKVLRSQAVDLPRYAERAMSYVPELVKEVVKKLAANVDDPIIGEQGADLILDKFNKEFDYHLYLEGENNTYRIYGRTPSMKPVVDFYAENKELVDSRLPKLEGFVEEILLKVAERLHHPDSDWAKKFKVHNIWALIVNEENKLTEPVDEASTAKFFTEVLSSEANIWNFAHETAMIYWDKVKSYLNDNISELGDYGKYIEKIPQIRPNFKYYIVPSASGVDIISEGNSQITDASTAWTLTKRDGFDVTFDATLSKNNGKEMYKTLYVDFAYELPENVKAYAITGINETTGFATKEEISGVIAAQTPVLLQATFDAEQTADQTMTLTLSTKAGTTPETNLLVGADYLINEYEINTPQVESIFSMLAKLSQSLANEYSYLKRKNAGTVNNKYFFGIAVEGELDKAYEEKTEDEMENTPVRILSMGNQKLGFYGSWDPVKNNEAFIVTENEELDPVKLFMKGDVYRDGVIDEKDLTALVEIVLGKVTIENKPDNYDFDAAYVNDDEYINIADVTALVNILKPQPQD